MYHTGQELAEAAMWCHVVHCVRFQQGTSQAILWLRLGPVMVQM